MFCFTKHFFPTFVSYWVLLLNSPPLSPQITTTRIQQFNIRILLRFFSRSLFKTKNKTIFLYFSWLLVIKLRFYYVAFHFSHYSTATKHIFLLRLCTTRTTRSTNKTEKKYIHYIWRKKLKWKFLTKIKKAKKILFCVFNWTVNIVRFFTSNFFLEFKSI